MNKGLGRRRCVSRTIADLDGSERLAGRTRLRGDPVPAFSAAALRVAGQPIGSPSRYHRAAFTPHRPRPLDR